MINRARKILIAGLGVAATLATVLWLISSVAGLGVYCRHDEPDRRTFDQARRTALHIDFAAGQAWVDYALTADPFIRVDQPTSQWTTRFYKRGTWLIHANAIDSSCATGQLYVPKFSWTPTYERTSGADFEYIKLTIPLYLACVILVPYPLLAFLRGPLRGRFRKKRGLCIACGYNLTGNISGRCPECGVLA